MTAATFPGSDYRPDIDGLRAVAVLAVVGFHADIAAFRGGFVGVDVFFVISGYLISGIIFRGLDRGTFSFADFYARRINRIFPALLVILVASAAIGWTILFSREFALLGKHIFGGAAFLSNFILWREAGYFDSPLKPFLHLWSLAVEEQFYLIWPSLVWLTWRSGSRNVPRMVLGLIVLSFLLNILAINNSYGTAAFYSPVTRFWQIMSGALLAYLEFRKVTWRDWLSDRHPTVAPLAAAAVALVLLIASFVLVTPSTQWPGWYAIVPVGATAVLIASGPDNWISRKILAHRGLVAIGLISYPLYLWHWPLIVFGHLLADGPVPRLVMAGIVLSSMILAAATYVWVEKPIRFGRRKRRSARILLSAMGATAVFGLVVQQQVIHPRLPRQTPAIETAESDWRYPGIGGLTPVGRHIAVDSIPGDTSQTVAFLGDSHVQQYWPRVVELSHVRRDSFPRVLFLTYGSCPPLPNVNRQGVDPLTRSPFECNIFHQKAIELLARPDIRTVVIGAYWEHYLPEGKTFPVNDPSSTLALNGPSTDAAFAGLEREISRFTRSGKRVFILLSNPTSPAFHPRSMYASRLRGFQEKKAVTAISKAEFLTRARSVSDRLRALAARTGAKVIDPTDYLCGWSTCRTVSADGVPIYMDEQHLRASFARRAATFIDSIFKD